MRTSSKSVAFTTAQRWPQSQVDWNLLEELSLSYLAFSDYIYHDRDMLIALMEKWDPNSNTFYLSTREMIVTLEDVYWITRLPIRGKLVNMVLIPGMEQAERWAMWLTGSDDINHKKREISLMRHVPKDPPARGDLRLRLLITYMLDAIVYPDKSSKKFPMGMVPIIQDMVIHR